MTVSPEDNVTPLSGLLDIPLDLEYIDTGLYRGYPRQPAMPRTFGGEVVAQALRAAGRTVPEDRPVHSLHAYFIRPGDPSEPVLFRVEETRDGGSFTTRRVVAQQHGVSILTMTSSFQRREEGIVHQSPATDAPPPESFADPDAALAAMDDDTRAWFQTLSTLVPVEVRFVDRPLRIAAVRGQPAPLRQRFWLRTRQRLPAEPLVHACAAAYASDLLLLSAAAAHHGLVVGQPGIQTASLDHAVWFHDAFRADDWLLYDQESHWAGGGRALCRGLLFNRAGTLVASVTQEGLLRRRRG